ncbi:FAD-dependent oxidoreductase [Luteococcus sanguinis]|uniref:FAD-dependent oxidoreductase n=1 Tax=Luteococcus sanguinis TaxID=174038 RepID=A0ABW1X1G9_9ACTN
MSTDTTSGRDEATKRYVIVGGVAGGMSTATRLRRLDENAEITVIERSGYVSFANCGLPYYVGGVIEQRSALLLQTPESLAARFGITVLVNTEVVSVNTTAREVTTRSTMSDETSTLAYDELVLSPGARPITPQLPGIERALALRDVEDTDAMAAAVAGAQTAVVIGGGFIGVEVAENLVHRGMQVSLVEATAQVMAPLDPEMATPVHQRLRDCGVDLRLGVSVTAIGDQVVNLSDGSTLPGEVVVAAIGVRPDTTLARMAGLTIGPRGGIAVDEKMTTSDPHVHAIGDAVEKVDGLSHETTLVPLANTANRQGRVLADILSGLPGADRPVLGTAIVGVFGLQVASTGWNEKRLVAAGRPYRALHTHPASHAGYYPGAAQLALKLLVDPETDEILGAQGIGDDGVDKRIDVIATAIAGGLTASDLADLELAYAPAFGSAKDPVNMLGYVDQNTAQGITDTVQWHEVGELMEGGVHLIDVRTPAEVANGAIPGAINIPVDELRDRLDELPEGDLVVSCAVGIRGHIAARMLTQKGRNAKNLDGGYRTWSAGMASRQNAAS